MNPETSNELRGLVREVLRETLASRGVSSAHGVEKISVSNETELQAFVKRLASPGVIEAVRAGKLRFTLNDAAIAPGKIGDVLEGVISEQKIDGLAGRGTLLLGPTAVLTPLARDKVRKLGLKIERKH